MRTISFGILVAIIFVACQSAETIPASPTEVATEAVAAVDPTPFPTTKSAETATAVVENTPESTQSAPATFTPAPTEMLPTETATSAPTDTPAPTEIVTDSNSKCLPLDAVADTKSPLLVVDGPWQRGDVFSGELHSVSSDNKLIHFGFDVEGDPGTLPEILDILDRHQVKTTMFIVGNWAETYPHFIVDFVERGHELANHTRTHGNLGEMSYEMVQEELNSTEATVLRLTGQTTKPWLRPPFGSRSEVSTQASFDAGWNTVIWSGSPDDWRTEFDVEDMCNSLVATSFPGGILYAHPWRPEMPEVIERYIGTMQAQGYTFVPLSVLMAPNQSSYLLQNQ